jgi:hypothetical protein
MFKESIDIKILKDKVLYKIANVRYIKHFTLIYILV